MGTKTPWEKGSCGGDGTEAVLKNEVIFPDVFVFLVFVTSLNL